MTRCPLLRFGASIMGADSFHDLVRDVEGWFQVASITKRFYYNPVPRKYQEIVYTAIQKKTTPHGQICWEFSREPNGEIVVAVDTPALYLLGRGTLVDALREVNEKARRSGVDVSQLFK